MFFMSTLFIIVCHPLVSRGLHNKSILCLILFKKIFFIKIQQNFNFLIQEKKYQKERKNKKNNRNKNKYKYKYTNENKQRKKKIKNLI